MSTSRNGTPLGDEEIAALLAAYDDALAAGALPASPKAPAENQSRLEDDLQGLHWLNKLRSSKPASQPADLAMPLVDSDDRYRLIRLHAEGGIAQALLAHNADLL